MNNMLTTEPDVAVTYLKEANDILADKVVITETTNPVLERALRRLKESQIADKHVAYYTKHGSHSTHSKSSW